MTSKDPIADAAHSLRQVAEVSRTCAVLRNAFLASRHQDLLDRYRADQERAEPIEKPDPNAVLLGFREDWREKDFAAIVGLGQRLDPDFLTRHQEAQAYYLAARKLCHEPR